MLDSYTPYFHYLGRASGEGTAGVHHYPWDEYFRRLFFWRTGNGPIWSEAAIGVLAVVGLFAGALGKGLDRAHVSAARFLGIYTAIMTVVYCALPYKTPWCAQGFFHGMILLGGIGTAVLLRLASRPAIKGIVLILLAVATSHLAWQAHRASFVVFEEPDNPYMYGHTSADVPEFARRIEEIASVIPHGENLPIQVFCPEDDHWPLPWYLRGFRRTGWPSETITGPAAPIIITQPSMKRALADYLLLGRPPADRRLVYTAVGPQWKKGPWDSGSWELRANVPLLLYVRLDLWDAYLAKKAPERLGDYDHPESDIPQLARRIEQIAAVHADGRAMHVQVIIPDLDYWPLPWHLRELGQVEWLPRIPDGPPAPLIVVQPRMEEALADYVQKKPPPGQRYLYVPLPPEQEDRDWQLRPGAPLRVYVRLDLWNAFEQAEAKKKAAAPSS